LPEKWKRNCKIYSWEQCLKYREGRNIAEKRRWCWKVASNNMTQMIDFNSCISDRNVLL
jgi:hypothetical protein